MSRQRIALWEDRAALVHRSAVLRDRLVHHSAGLAPALGVLEKVRGGARWAREHPWIALPPVALLLWRRPARIWRWGRRVWWAAGWWKRASIIWKQRG